MTQGWLLSVATPYLLPLIIRCRSLPSAFHYPLPVANAALAAAAAGGAAVTEREEYELQLQSHAREQHRLWEVEAAEECRRAGVPYAPASSISLRHRMLGAGESGWVIKGSREGTKVAIKVKSAVMHGTFP